MSITLAELARELGLEHQGEGSRRLSRVSGWDEAGPGSLIYCDSPSKAEALPDELPAGALLAPREALRSGWPAVISARAKLDFARAACLISPPPVGAPPVFSPPPAPVPPVPPVPLVLHVPAWHACPAGHWLPQPPQLAGSDSRSAQTPAHAVRPGRHWHAPPSHVCPGRQAMSHAPQLLTSLARSTQATPQPSRPGGHTHVPLTQV